MIRVGEIRKTSGEEGDAGFTLDKKKKIRIIVSATDYVTAEKNADLAKDPPEEGIACEANRCSVHILLRRR
jgi:hypothetical protein